MSEKVAALWAQSWGTVGQDEIDAIAAATMAGGFTRVFYGAWQDTSAADRLAQALPGIPVDWWVWCGGWPGHYPVEWDVRYGFEQAGGIVPPDAQNYHWFDFSSQEARAWLAAEIVGVLAKYPSLRGVHLDALRYQHEDWLLPYFDTLGGVDETMQLIYGEVKALNSDLTVSAAVTSRWYHAEENKQNWHRWTAGEYVDWVFPLLYCPRYPLEDIVTWAKWCATAPNVGRVFPGLWANPTDEIISQLVTMGEAGLRNDRFAIFQYKLLDESSLGELRDFIEGEADMGIAQELSDLAVEVEVVTQALVAHVGEFNQTVETTTQALVARAGELDQKMAELRDLAAALAEADAEAERLAVAGGQLAETL